MSVTFLTLDWRKGQATNRIQQVLRYVGLHLAEKEVGATLFFEHDVACGTVKKGAIAVVGAFSGPTFVAKYVVPDSQLDLEVSFMIPSSSLGVDPMTESGIIRVFHTTREGTEQIDEYDSREVHAPEVISMSS